MFYSNHICTSVLACSSSTLTCSVKGEGEVRLEGEARCGDLVPSPLCEQWFKYIYPYCICTIRLLGPANALFGQRRPTLF